MQSNIFPFYLLKHRDEPLMASGKFVTFFSLALPFSLPHLLHHSEKHATTEGHAHIEERCRSLCSDSSEQTFHNPSQSKYPLNDVLIDGHNRVCTDPAPGISIIRASIGRNTLRASLCVWPEPMSEVSRLGMCGLSSVYSPFLL